MTNPQTTFLPEPSWQSIVRSLGLSDREAQVAGLILGDGSCETAMAASLAISPHTVHTHLERIYRKLRVTSRSQVVSRIFQVYVNQGAATQVAQSAPAIYARRRPDRRAQTESRAADLDSATPTKAT